MDNLYKVVIEFKKLYEINPSLCIGIIIAWSVGIILALIGFSFFIYRLEKMQGQNKENKK